MERLKNDVAETKGSLAVDQELAAKLAESCSSQPSEWEERKRLNDDDALEQLFWATLSCPSLVLVQSSTVMLSNQALDELCSSLKDPNDLAPNLKLVALALSGKSVDLCKIASMIEEMLTLFNAEQGDDVGELRQDGR